MEYLIISKELLSEVLNYEVDIFLGINKNEIDYTCCRDENEGYIDISINIYEFAYKCKEWAYKIGFSYIGNNKIINIHSSDGKIIAIINDNVEKWFDIEIDIIACNWILENSK